MVSVNDTFSENSGDQTHSKDAAPRIRPDLYFPGLNSKELSQAITEHNEECCDLTAKTDYVVGYQGLSREDCPELLADTISWYEKLSASGHKIASYLTVCQYQDFNRQREINAVRQRFRHGQENALMKILKTLNQYPNLMETPALAPYKDWFARKRHLLYSLNFRPDDVLSKERSLVIRKQETGREPMQQLYKQLISDISVEIDGRDMALDEVWDYMQTADNPDRKKAWNARFEALAPKMPMLTTIYNALLKDNAIDASIQYDAGPGEGTHRQNFTDRYTADQLAEGALAGMRQLSERYYKWVADKMGREKAPRWARAPGSETIRDKTYSWDDARELVLRAFYSYSREMGDTAREIFDAGAVDAAPDRCKPPGARCIPVSADIPPAILMKFNGTQNDVETLAHEMGHAVHFLMAGRQHGQFTLNIPTTVAETASLFAETLLYKQQMREAADEAEQDALTALFIGSKIGNINIQAAFHHFETQAHNARQYRGELSTDELNELWRESMEQAFGPNREVDEASATGWAAVPHFFHQPFYNYGYVFGGIMSALMDKRDEEADIQSAFRENVTDMLKTGSAETPLELFKKVGIDIGNWDEWKQGMRAVTKLMDRLDGIDTDATQTPANDNPQDNRVNGFAQAPENSAFRYRGVKVRRLTGPSAP